MIGLSVIFLVGCTSLVPKPTPTELPQPTATNTPFPTTAQVTGVLMKEDSVPINGANVNLIALEKGEDGSFMITYSGMSIGVNEGVYLFEEVIPGYYFLTVNQGGGMPQDIVDEQGERIVIFLEAGDVLDMGETIVK